MKKDEKFQKCLRVSFVNTTIYQKGFFLSLLFLFSLSLFGYSQSDGLPRGAFEMPYTRYESDDGNYGGGAILHQAINYDEFHTAAEASDQRYVGLPSNGSFVEWTMHTTGAGVALRFTMPDSSSGNGESGSLDFYVNGSKVKTVDLTSYWAYQYFPNSEPENTPGARPRMRFDEVHFLLDNPLNVGDVLRIQKNNGDSFEYGIDFVEVEDVPAPLQKPAGFISVLDYGAVADDGNDDLPAFEAALAAAGNAGTGLYIPAGTFTLDNKWIVEENGISIMGAGIWYTNIFFSNKNKFSGGIMARASEIEISDFSMNTANNARFFVPGDYMIYKGFMGTYGHNSSIHDVWVTHFECGAWIGGYDPPYPIDITSNLSFYNNRIRNNYADGINFCQGTNNSTVYQCNFRSNGDDAMACWPNDAFSAPVAVNNTWKFNTIEHNYRAGGAAIFGGDGHEVHHCLFKDGMGSSAIRLTTDFPGYDFSNTTAIRFYENTIIACGTSNDLWNAERGCIEINASQKPIKNIFFENIDIINAHRHAIQIGSTQSVDAYFDNITINGTGLDGQTDATYTSPLEGAAVMIYTGSGSATFNNLSMENIALDPPIYEARPGFNLTIQNTNIPLNGVSLSKSTVDALVGDDELLNVIFSPTNATNKSVTWSSSNSNVATYDAISGKIIAHGVGTAVLTVTTTEGGHTAQVTVNVHAAVIIEATKSVATEKGDKKGEFVISTTSLQAPIEVKYQISGTASANDYVASPALTGVVTLSPSNLSQTITITGVKDDEFEGDETLILTLSEDASYRVGKMSSAIVTIIDNNAPPCTAPSIVYTSVAPIIDHLIDEVWNDAPAMSIDKATIGSKPAGFNAQWRAMFDQNNLYVLVESSADVLNNDSGDEWWNDDVIEIFIDGDNSKKTSYDGLNDFQFAFRWNDPEIKVGQSSVQNISGIDFNMYETSIGFNVEVKIPWTTIGVAPEIGKQIGFDVAIDGDGNGGEREYQVSSFANSDMGWSDPSLFGSVYLTSCDDEGFSTILNSKKVDKIFSFYPNPITKGETLNIVLSDEVVISKLQIIDMTGKVVYISELTQGDEAVYGLELNRGIYFIQVISGDYSYTEKVVVR